MSDAAKDDAGAREDRAHDVWICDFSDADDRADFTRLMVEFAAEPTSASAQLDAAHFTRVADDLSRRAGTLVLLAARAESEATEGVLIAFEGYSSFARAPLFNIHDVHVTTSARGSGLGSSMIEALAELGREHRHAKLTLEVSATNTGAIRLYRRLGFSGLDNLPVEAPSGTTYFANKKL